MLAAINIIDIFLHLDRYLDSIIRDYQAWTYLILFVVVFCETGLVVTPFLPGDSLLFAAGTLAARQGCALDIRGVLAVLGAAAICGDSSNYWIGRLVGPKVFFAQNVRFLNREYLDRAHRFYQKHGGKTVAVARFLPILRTFVPFVAGIGKMVYARFVTFSVCGTLAWVCTFVLGGYFFGNIPVVSRNFTLVIMAIVVISLAPTVIAHLRQRLSKTRAVAASGDSGRQAGGSHGDAA